MGSLSDMMVRDGHGLIAVPGGVLLLDKDGYIVGAIGVSGDTSDNDEKVAINAVLKSNLNLVPNPSKPVVSKAVQDFVN